MGNKVSRVMNKYIYKNSNATLNLNDGGASMEGSYNTFVLEPPGDGTITVNMPSCASVVGEIYTFCILVIGDGSIVFNTATDDLFKKSIFNSENDLSTKTKTICCETVRMMATYQPTRTSPNFGTWVRI